MYKSLCVMGALALVTGCATLDPDAGTGAVLAEYETRAGQAWPESDALDALLDAPLDADAAVRVALLVNPRVRASLDTLHVGEAERVAAILPSNPTLELERDALKLMQPLLDLLQSGSRRQRADAGFEVTRLEVTRELLGFERQVRDAWVAAVAAGQREKLAEDAVVAAEAAVEFMRALREAGNVTTLALAEEELRHADALIAHERAGAEWDSRRHELGALLGLRPGSRPWRTLARLPEPGADAYSVDAAEVIEASLALGAARTRIEVLALDAGIADARGWMTELELGIAAARGGERTAVLALELPLFDTGAARRAGARQVDALELYWLTRNAQDALRAGGY